ncbi:unnamed protein product [Parnassius apollo]|uniref:Gustatory receptor n=1 Tax=Parnassius apollo TaxID=110799 RepID=A0A8S3XI86_PARAO|nr:unnamed protein product [Parnassius apollo]
MPVNTAFSTSIGITLILGTWLTFRGPRRMKELIENLNSAQKVFESLTLKSLNDGYKLKEIERRKVNLLKLFLVILVSLLTFELWIVFQTGLSTKLTKHAAHLAGSNAVKEIIRVMLFCFGYLTMHSLNMLFIFVVLEVHILLQMMNQQLRILSIEMKQTNTNVNIAMRFAPKTLRHLAMLSISLSDQIRKLNSENGIFLIITLLVSAMYFELSSFSLIIDFTDKENISLDILLHVTRTAFNLASIVLLIEPCQWICTEMDVTKMLLNRIMYNIPSFAGWLENELYIFFHLIHENEVCFSPLEFFVLGRPFIFKILGAVISYLVIIFQFDVQA